MALTDLLIQMGAPVLKNTIENSVGGVGGKLAGAAIDALAGALGTSPDPAAIERKINENPQVATQIVQQVEVDWVKALQSTNEAMVSYHGVLLADAGAQGILSRLWRPLFAIVFTICFAATVISILSLLWTSNVAVLTTMTEVFGFLTFMFLAGCAVLGVYVWRQPKDK